MQLRARATLRDETHWLGRTYLNRVELVLKCVGNYS